MRLSRGIYRCICLLVASVWTLGSAHGQNLSFTLVEQIVIGNDEEAPAEYQFTSPEQVRTDSKGNMYVHDRRRADIRVFNGTGHYMATIGRRGEGPGELREIIGMHVDDQDRLIVADRSNQRFTIFTDLGERFETKAFPSGSWVEPDPILQVGDMFILKYVRVYDDSGGRRPYISDSKTLHQYDVELNWMSVFAELDELFDFSKPFEKASSDIRRALKMASNGNDNVVLVPSIYGGVIYRYTLEHGVWNLEKLNGGPVPQKAYMLVTEKEYDSDFELQRSSRIVSGPSGVHLARIFNWSLGIVILSTGEMVNFTMQTPLRGEFGHRVELYDQSGALRGYGPLRFSDRTLNRSDKIMSDIQVLWIDDDDQIYLRRPNKHGFYVLSVAELVIEEL